DAPLGKKIFEVVNVAPTLSLGITPNRPDLLSHVGVAREVSAATGQRLKPVNTRVTEMGPDSASLARVVVEDTAGCKRYVARVVRNIQVGPSPAWLRDRLERIGQRSINNIVDATNYVLHELGHPLHAFDLSLLAVESGLPTIRVRSAREGEVFTTLDGAERKLDETDLVIADVDHAVALAGVMGGANTEVSEGTTSVLLESAWFEPIRVRRTARRHSMHTDSSHRFERGADPAIVVKAIDRCAQLLVDIAGGEVAKGIVEVSQKIDPPAEITLRLDHIPKLLGVEWPAEETVQLLEPLEIRCIARNEHALRFQPPTFRPDLTREVDLIEELARRHGYDAIPERLPDASGDYHYLPPSRRPADVARTAMLASGCTEAVTFGFGSPSVYRDAIGGGEEPVRLLNPLGEELSAMRTSLLPGLLTSLGRNQRHGARSACLFEIGVTFHARQPSDDDGVVRNSRDELLPRETERVACLLWGGRYHGRWYEHDETFDFSDVAGVVEALSEAFELAYALRRVPAVIPGLNPHASAELHIKSNDDTLVGFAGQLHPDRVRQLDIVGPVLVAEISLDALARLSVRRVKHTSLPRFPGTRRDVAVVAERSISAERLRSFLAENAGGDFTPTIVERVRLFDVYEGKPIPPTHVSLAFAIEYRHAERTLTDAEVNAAFESVVRRLEEEHGVEVRE
ncbi:MAG: phenylalanine--tRNA ligase subunit beta, partial [Myxococcota bacterium]